MLRGQTFAEYSISSSIGITLFNGNAHSVEELLAQADIAMYKAKIAGRNTMRVFMPSMRKNLKVHAASNLS